MGQLKQLLPLGGKPMVRRVVETASSVGLAQVVVVTGARADEVIEALADLPVMTVINEAWAEGMSTSVRAGLLALRPEIRAALMILADQPALTRSVLDALIARYQDTTAPIVAPCYRGRRGNPVLIDRALFPELLAIEGDQGARALIRQHEERLEVVEVDDVAVVADVDTRQDYAAAQETEWDK